MPSPFPGMGPYIGQPKIWVDFHNRFADEISVQLNTRIRPAYFARLTPYTTYEVVGISQARVQGIHPDVGVMQRDTPPYGTPTAVLEETLAIERAVEMETDLELLRFVKVWPIVLHAKLPIISVPLKAPDPDVMLDLGNVIANAYECGGYDVQLDYSAPVPPPSLTENEPAWLQQYLTERRARS